MGCSKHRDSEIVTKADGKPRCKACAVEGTDRARKKRKRTLIESMGGKCEVCGYDKCDRALTFHHRDPTTKEFSIGAMRTISLDKALHESKKCALLCFNCHMEVESGMIELESMRDSGEAPH